VDQAEPGGAIGARGPFGGRRGLRERAAAGRHARPRLQDGAAEGLAAPGRLGVLPGRVLPGDPP
jgi:hypothetical protein